MSDKRESTGFMIKQRAYLKLFILTKIGTRRIYGKQILDELKVEFEPYGYKPYLSEVYKGLQELLEDGYIRRQRVKVGKSKYKEIYLYYIRDMDKVRAYKKLVKADLDRCVGLLNYGLKYNFD